MAREEADNLQPIRWEIIDWKTFTGNFVQFLTCPRPHEILSLTHARWSGPVLHLTLGLSCGFAMPTKCMTVAPASWWWSLAPHLQLHSKRARDHKDPKCPIWCTEIRSRKIRSCTRTWYGALAKLANFRNDPSRRHWMLLKCSNRTDIAQLHRAFQYLSAASGVMGGFGVFTLQQ